MEKIDAVPSFWEFKGLGEYSDRKFLMASPFPIVFILIAYLWFVLKLGPELMKNRKPIKLDKILVFYNVSQVLFSCYVVILAVPELKKYGLYHKECYSDHEHFGRQVSDAAHMYFLGKVVELLDTIFFVLRKKQNQVTFLHVYHHTLMALSVWCVVKYTATDSTVFIGFINSLVHVIMYTYYGLSVFPSLTKYLWWKKYLTVFQLVQFCLMFLHIVVSHVTSDCNPNYVLLYTVCSNTILFFYLFRDFYNKSYTKKNKDNAENSRERATTMSTVNGKNGLDHLKNHSKLAAKIQ